MTRPMANNTMTRLIKYAATGCVLCKARFLNKNIPIRIDFNITNRCNQRCSYCYVDFNELAGKKDMTMDQIRHLINDFHSRGMRSVRLMGGEPLLRDDLGEIIDLINKKNILCEVNTNGFFVKRWLEELRKVDSVCLSIDGEEHGHDIVRGKGSYRKAVEALEFLVSHHIKTRIHGVLSKYTLKSLRHMAELARRYHVTFTSAPCCAQDLDKRDPNLSLTLQEYVDFYREYLALKKAGYPILTSYRSIQLAVDWPFKEDLIIYPEDLKGHALPKGYRVIPCQYGHRSCYIDGDGRMYACSRQWKIGLNYFEHGFEKCWDYLQQHVQCVTCRTINDFSLAFSLEPSIVKELIRDMISR